MLSEIFEITRNRRLENVNMSVGDQTFLVLQDLRDIKLAFKANSSILQKDLRWLRQMTGPSRITENGPEWTLRRDLTNFRISSINHERSQSIAKRVCESTLKPAKFREAPASLQEITYSIVFDSFIESFFEVDRSTLGLTPILYLEISKFSFNNSVLSKNYLGSLEDRERISRLKRFSNMRQSAIRQLSAFRSPKLAENPIISRILQASRDGAIPSFEVEILTIVSAGVDAAAAALSWSALALARSEALKTRVLRSDHTSGMKEASRILDASLRYFPPFPLLPRRAESRLTLETVTILQNASVLINLMHFSSSSAEQLLEALISDCMAHPPQTTPSFPFSGGERVCPGASFAKAILPSLIVMLANWEHLQAFNHPCDFDWQLALMPIIA